MGEMKPWLQKQGIPVGLNTAVKPEFASAYGCAPGLNESLT